jgi:predicted nuclease with RNAse H fold
VSEPAVGRSWAGVDVGGRRKGFHVALVDRGRLLELASLRRTEEVAAWLSARRPELVAVDSPRSAAPPGETSRPGERELARSRVCNIRWTPDEVGLASNPVYYEWIQHGLELYAALDQAGLAAIECFPTASWSRWAGPRGDRRRGEWSQASLESLGLALPARRLSQDDRDAIGAALTALAHADGATEAFGDIVVPLLRTNIDATLSRAPRERVPVLLLTGPVGAGKSTVGMAAASLLREAEIPSAFVDLPGIAVSFPSPPDDPWNERLSHENLACMWANFQQAGARRLIVARVLETRSLLHRIEEAVPGADVTVVRLEAPLSTIQQRIRSRDPKPDWYLSAGASLHHSMNEAALEDHLVENHDASPEDIARAVLRTVGWLP